MQKKFFLLFLLIIFLFFGCSNAWAKSCSSSNASFDCFVSSACSLYDPLFTIIWTYNTCVMGQCSTTVTTEPHSCMNPTVVFCASDASGTDCTPSPTTTCKYQKNTKATCKAGDMGVCTGTPAVVSVSKCNDRSVDCDMDTDGTPVLIVHPNQTCQAGTGCTGLPDIRTRCTPIKRCAGGNLETVKQKCDKANQRCTEDLSQSITTVECDDPNNLGNPRCRDNNNLVFYDALCSGTSPNAYCGQLVERTITNCPQKYNNRACSIIIDGYKRHWQDNIYKCGKNISKQDDCVFDSAASSSGDCALNRRECLSDNKSYNIIPGEKCNSASTDPVNSPNCISDGTSGGTGKCTTEGDCTMKSTYDEAWTYDLICNTNYSQSQNCVRSGAYSKSKCDPELKSCINNNTIKQTIPREICREDDNTNPADGGTHGVCHSGGDTTTKNCSDIGEQYECVNDFVNRTFYEQILTGFCNSNKDPKVKPPIIDCDTYWANGKNCTGMDQLGKLYCSSVGIMQEKSIWGCTLPNGSQKPAVCGAIKTDPILKQDCPVRCIDWRYCEGTKIKSEKHCVGCKESGGSPTCTSWIEQGPDQNCAPASESATTYCSGGVKCTLTAEYSGECLDIGNGSAGCKPPTISVVCDGTCGPGGPCSPAGGTQACPGGGSQTCGGDGFWGPCECQSGQSMPHSACDENGNCSIVNSCGVSDCSNCGCVLPDTKPHTACVDEKCVSLDSCGLSGCINCGGCPAGQSKPHYACVNNICTSVNTCGVSDCSNCGGCPAGQSKPHSACVDGECQSVNSCGVSDCSNCSGCGAGESNPHSVCDENGQCVSVSGCGVSDCSNCSGTIVNKCDADPQSPTYKQCTLYGTGIACGTNNECVIKYCDNINKQCVEGGDSGVPCKDSADCLTKPKCNITTKKCAPNGEGMFCAVDNNCKTTYCDYQTRKCIFGGDSGIFCVGSADCETQSRCNDNQECTATGDGILCNNDLDCQDQSAKCVGNSATPRQCVENECGGADCSLANGNKDCQYLPTQCNECQQCVPGGGGADCSVDSDCDQKFTCNGDRQCVPDDYGAVACSVDSQCENYDMGCNAYRQCVPGGGGEVCDNDADCRQNEPPSPVNLVSGPGNYCTGIPGIGLANFSWEYESPDGIPESGAELQIIDSADTVVVDLQTGVSNRQQIFVALGEISGYIRFNQSYAWRVKVWDVFGNESDWIYAPSVYEQVGHPAPTISYIISPNPVAFGETANFADNGSVCYTGAGDYYCKDGLGLSTTYEWNIDGHISNGINVSYTYDGENKSYLSTLTICDDGGCCSNSQEVKVKKSSKDVPWWKEISPFW